MNNRPIPCYILLACGLLFALTSRGLAATARKVGEEQKIIRRDAHRSPDGSLIASVVFLKQRHSYGDPPSCIEIRRADGRLLARKDYSSYRGQGYTVRKAAWTADGRFFVYSMDSSGGHGPWHRPVSFYSRKKHRFYSLDNTIGELGHEDGSITGDMRLRSPCTVVTKGRYYGKSRNGIRVSTEPADGSGDHVLAIDLGRLEPRREASMEDIKF